MSKRELLAQGLDCVGLLAVAARIRRFLPARGVPVFTYHRIAEISGRSRYCASVVDASPATLRSQLEVIARWSTVIGIEDLRACIAGGRLPPAPVILAFDDGYRSCVDVAFPLLRELGLRATFFVSTQHIEERRVFWWDRIGYLIAQTRRASIRLHYPRMMEVELADREQAVKQLVAVVDEEPKLNLDRMLAELSEAAGVEWTRDLERELASELILSWDDVRTLRDGGMEVQSHTRRHSVLHRLRPSELADELAGSKRDLERELGGRVHSVAYPQGHAVVARAGLRKAVSEAGYELGFSCDGGISRLSDLDPYDIKRIPVDSSHSLAMFRMQVALPGLAYVSRPGGGGASSRRC